jgi:hypothetical protein
VLRACLDRAGRVWLATVEVDQRDWPWVLARIGAGAGSLRLRCPAPSPESLQAAALEGAALDRRYRALVDGPVRFTGILYRRVHRR